MVTIRKLSLGPIQTNCYIIRSKDQALIIDPSGEAQKIRQVIEQAGVKVQAVLLTHAHFDHIMGLEDILEMYPVPVYMHKKEVEWLTEPLLNGSGKYAELPNISVDVAPQLVREGELTIGDFTIEVLETPGHSPGSVSYLFKEEGFVVSGDVLFQGSIGRTDLVDGDMNLLLSMIKQKLLTLPEETIVYSGHGPETTLADEMDHNPFLNGF